MSSFPPLAFYAGIEYETYYGSESDPIVEICLVVLSGEPIDHTACFIIVTQDIGMAGKFTMTFVHFMLSEIIKPFS